MKTALIYSKIFTISFLFFTFDNFIFGNNINSKKEILDSIQEKIIYLKEEQNKLEILKIQLEKKSVDLSQGVPQNKKPVIALVLSGGGARGAAHIGVLKVLEKYNIPIDIVVGTSIGSIIGSMYAVGYSPVEIEELVLKMDFNELLSNTLDKNFQKNLEKNTYNKYPISLNIDKNLEFSVPSGLVNGEKIYLQLKNIFSPVEEIKKFDELPRKLRIVTTELYSGKEVVLSQGDIALSIFKSMAIPSFLSPVQDGNSFYIDGGIVNNLPTDIALEMGADIIIAVDITADKELIKNTTNLSAVVSGIFNYSGDKNSQINKKLADILIKPSLGQHGIIDFRDLSNLIDSGELAAEKESSLLEKLGDEESFLALKSKYINLGKKEFFIKNISLENSNLLSLEQVKALDSNQIKNSVYTKDDFEDWSKKIYSLNYISRVFYEVKNEEIIFSVLEKENSNLNLALNYSTYLGASVRTGLSFQNLNFTKRNYFLDFSISKYPFLSLRTDFFPEFFNYNIISSSIIGYSQSPFLIWKKDDNISTFSTNNFYLENLNAFNFSNNLSLGINLKYNILKNIYSQGSKDFPEFEFNKKYLKTSTYAIYQKSSNSSFLFNNLSLYGDIFSGNNLLSKENINFYGYIFSGEFEKKITDKFMLTLSGSSGKIKNDFIPKNEFFKLGGIRNDLKNNLFSFYGLAPMQRYSNNFQLLSSEVKYPILSTANLIGKYNLAWLDSEFLIGYGIGLEWKTFFGPMDFVLSNNQDGNNLLFQVYLGYTF